MPIIIIFFAILVKFNTQAINFQEFVHIDKSNYPSSYTDMANYYYGMLFVE
jgi:hypothetical protein